MKRRKIFRPTTILEYVLLTLLAALFLFPMIWMVVSSMKPEADVYKNLTGWQALPLLKLTFLGKNFYLVSFWLC